MAEGDGSAGRAAVVSLRLAQYRSHRLSEIETAGASVVLTGANGAGKTNVIEAVSMLVPGRGLRRMAAEDAVRRPDRLGWRVTALVETGRGDIEVETGVEDPATPRRGVQIDGKAVAQAALGRAIRMVWLTPAMDRLWTEAAADRRQFLDRMAMGFQPDHAEAALAYDKAMRARNRLLREAAEGRAPDPAWLGGLEVQMARAGARLARARVEAVTALQAAQHAGPAGGAEHETLFPKARLSIVGDMEIRFATALAAGDDLDALETETAARAARALEAARPRDGAAGRTLDGPHRSDLEAVYEAKDMPARDCSTGEQKALLVSLCLANARALAAHHGASPILLFDELAAHLDARRRAALFAEVEALGAQAWMTGTGPELFEGLKGARRFAVTEEGGATRVAPA
ncbi:MAG: DNA replication/repair protein RecF [Pseudomonadota bacterium]